ncbi:type II toxin-antitoxin system PemK/MazF family toxin [Bacillus sp. REN16]|uniref:type II toxin-antitoxin system PemK/MazF family toxin n=1 Tax=Bacillus sp. REN16 TaxID=2887296 RepID=UPI001E3C3022|nr:type II toxin-antitoxin system PemK/MazF family toxin [Bacillus sp. REN16]MCC3359374.1 type II toxin-antitoxin system PemK/MazF family toxin [Bacillus sp. REN16]
MKNNTVTKPHLASVLNATTQLVEESKLKNGIPHLIFQDLWNEYSLFGPQYDSYDNGLPTRDYKRGEKVSIDFGVGLDRELAFPHPAIVLYNFERMIIVVPTTSDDGNVLGSDMNPAIIRCQGDGRIFLNDTLINLHHIRGISKNRVRSYLNCNVKDYIVNPTEVSKVNLRYGFDFLSPTNSNLLDVIDAQLGWLVSPSVSQGIKDINKKLNGELRINSELDEKLKEQLKISSELDEKLNEQLRINSELDEKLNEQLRINSELEKNYAEAVKAPL